MMPLILYYCGIVKCAIKSIGWLLYTCFSRGCSYWLNTMHFFLCLPVFPERSFYAKYSTGHSEYHERRNGLWLLVASCRQTYEQSLKSGCGRSASSASLNKKGGFVCSNSSLEVKVIQDALIFQDVARAASLQMCLHVHLDLILDGSAGGPTYLIRKLLSRLWEWTDC